MWYELGPQLCFFACGLPVLSALFVEKIIHWPSNFLGTLLKGHKCTWKGWFPDSGLFYGPRCLFTYQPSNFFAVATHCSDMLCSTCPHWAFVVPIKEQQLFLPPCVVVRITHRNSFYLSLSITKISKLSNLILPQTMWQPQFFF